MDLESGYGKNTQQVIGPAAAAIGLLKKIGREFMKSGTYESIAQNAITYEELNHLAKPSALDREEFMPS